MILVLDSSVALKWVLPEPLSDKARQLRDDFEAQLHHLLAPNILPAECAHALTRAERRKIWGRGCSQPLTDILTSAPQLHPHEQLLPRALAVSSMMRIGFYDCLYVALAEREKCELITSDDKLNNSLQAKFSFIKHLSSIP